VIIVKVILPIPIRQYFKYFMPDSMQPIIGSRILVPFNSKEVIGIVVSFYKTTDISQLHLKYVKALIDTKSIYTNIVLNLLIWVSKNCHCPAGNLFFSVLPKILHSNYIIKNKYIFQWSITKKGKELDLNFLKRKKKQLYALFLLKKNSIISTELKKHNLSRLVLKKLEIQKLCKVNISYKPFFKEKTLLGSTKNFFLNKKTLMNINNILIKKCFSSWLLTKTSLYAKVKFYLGLIDTVLHAGMQILIVVPYNKNINVILVFLTKYFNVSIDVMHSKLTNTKHLKTWFRTKNGDNSIVIGTRKSIFLPFLKLGIIIFLEEHNLEYKVINLCRYNVRDLGILRAYKENIPIILDSDTPSLKILYNILHKKCFYINLFQRNNIEKLNNSIIDLKKNKIKFGLSLTLINEIYKNFKKKQVLLIFNKFNLFFSILKCKKCHWIFKCSHCHDYFEVNEYHNLLFCRFCLIQTTKPSFCSNCGCLSLDILNLGIEEVKNKIKNIFPKITLFFLLNQNNCNKDILNKNFFEFSICSPCIIITTEKIVQKYYFPHVKLIGLICIDQYFLSFNFRDIEYFAQFYINLSQLTKSRKKIFKILIQTSFPDNPSLKEICDNRYFSFSKKILLMRKNFLLPPWSFQSIVYSKSMNFENNIIFLNLIRNILKQKSYKYNCFLWFVGPHFSFFLKNKTEYLHQLLIQCSSRIILNNILNESIDLINIFTISKRVKWFIDIEPH